MNGDCGKATNQIRLDSHWQCITGRSLCCRSLTIKLLAHTLQGETAFISIPLLKSMLDMGSKNLPDSSAPLTDAVIRSLTGLGKDAESVSPSWAKILNRRLLAADGFVVDTLPRNAVPFRIAIVSLLFNWPSTGGGIVHTAELAQFLSLDGYDVCHFFAVYEPWSVGAVTESLPYNSCAMPVILRIRAFRLQNSIVRCSAIQCRTISSVAPPHVLLSIPRRSAAVRWSFRKRRSG